METAKSDNSGDNSDGDDQDESSSPPLHEVLQTFREEWHKELRVSPKRQPVPFGFNDQQEEDFCDDYERKARVLFQKGIDMEKAGKLYEAIQFYRRAVQIVPDIEFRLEHNSSSREGWQIEDKVIAEDSKSSSNNSSSDNSDDEDLKDGEVFSRIQKKLAKTSLLCATKFEQKTTHLSALPFEIVLLILRWLVSIDLDLRSLEMFARVCRGFYLCARDPEIWRLACIRVWGLNCGKSPGLYESWRDMFIERPRIHFHGCYISKTTYVRHGENSFQDQFYRPWHLVAYYRYLRFFPEGLVLMLTSAEEPAQSVGQLKYRQSRTPVLTGYYRLKDDKITLLVHPQETKNQQGGLKKKERRKDRDYNQLTRDENIKQSYHIELQIKNHNTKRHAQLVWSHYAVTTRNLRGDESTCDFDMKTNRFPPLWFSRVKSFTSESDAPLQ